MTKKERSLLLQGNETERGAPRSESEIPMIASGNHTIMNAQWFSDYNWLAHALPAAARRRNNPRSASILDSCRGLFHGTVGVNHWVTSLSAD
ncbi:MAG: hypothetical protein MR762_15100 [Clostridiales bacterium]|nr:hypothetical protein [Clostridiales bacterium]